MKKVDLVYNVYHENSNRRKIEVVNILGYSIVKKKLDELRKLYRKGLKKFLSEGTFTYHSYLSGDIVFKGHDDFYEKFKTEIFAPEFKNTLMYYFWSKCECEIILTNWPTSFKVDIEKLDATKHDCRDFIDLEVAEKIDMYDQVMNNWQLVLDYVWNNLEKANLKVNY